MIYRNSYWQVVITCQGETERHTRIQKQDAMFLARNMVAEGRKRWFSTAMKTGNLQKPPYTVVWTAPDGGVLQSVQVLKPRKQQ